PATPIGLGRRTAASGSHVLLEISRILNTGLDMETLSICVRLCEQGINPEALSSVIKELRKATEALQFPFTSISSIGSLFFTFKSLHN
uniref:Mitotic spindle organizing protein 1 n=1 Tax=Chelonoidis abingdonii TaxID=106734 RepID=A0A8C0J2I1_CHEAB